MIFNDKGSFDALTKTAVIMRDGVYTYLAGEIPSELVRDVDPEKKLRVYRSPESVRAAFKRFKELGKIPVVFEHPDEDLDPEDLAQGYGYDPELIEDGINLAIKCKLKLKDESKEAYEDLGVREISCGWSGDFVEAESENSPYDYEQTFDEFNHIALVPEGRCGSLCSIKDQKYGVNKMKVKAKKVKDKKSWSAAKKYLDEIAKIAKESEEIEDSHAEGLLTAIKGLKDAISGFEAFAAQENKEPTLDEDPKAEEEYVDEDSSNIEAGDRVEVKEVKDEQSELDKEDERVGEDEELDEEEDAEVEDAEADEEEICDEDVDKRELIRKADAIAMKPSDEFKGGAEEKFRTLTGLMEKLGYNASSRGTMNDAKAKRVLDAKVKSYLKKRINDAANLGMKLAVKRFHDVLPYIADGTIPYEDIKPGMTPCEIKQRFVQERTGRRINDAKVLNVAFDMAARMQFHDGWRAHEEAADILDKKADFIDSIGTKRQSKGDK